jgi:hypothetical protein
MNRLAIFLKKIDDSNPIELNKFYNLIDSYNLPRPRQPNDIEARQIRGQEYSVSFIHPDLMSTLEKLAAVDNGSRTTASLQNNSHATNVNGSFLIVRQGIHEPSVVMIDQYGEYKSTVTYSSEALIIENRQNFIDVAKTVSFLESHTSFRFTDGLNIIFAEGNEVPNKLHKTYLSRYDKLYLCMDFDLGGLTIANNLMSLLPDMEIIFLVPDDIALRLDTIVERVSNKEIDAVIKLGQANSSLLPYAKLIKDKQKVLEQESYLHGK